jgi:hypothetical protein
MRWIDEGELLAYLIFDLYWGVGGCMYLVRKGFLM